MSKAEAGTKLGVSESYDTIIGGTVVASTVPSSALTTTHAGAQFMYRLWRDPANVDGEDTYPDDAAVQTFGLHVLIDTLGSAGVGTK